MSNSSPSTSITTIKLSTRLLVDGLQNPLYVTAPPGDNSRIFILEQKSGKVKIFDFNLGRVLNTPFLTIPQTELLDNGFEQGLLGLAFHPQYAQNGKFYLSYTAFGGGAAGQTKVVEYQVSSNNPNQADPNTARTILTIPQPQINHNGGWLAFGKDGYLYWASGDGGGSGFIPGIPSESDNAQILTNNLLGKILRLDINRDAFPSDPNRNYAIPGSNPFVNQVGDDEIWAYGLRNPWRPSFDRLTGDLYIADVGQNSREEINFQPRASRGGENYGWNRFEGTLPYKPGPIPSNLVDPIYEYNHTVGRSVTGGYVYRGGVLEMSGTYFFGDFSTAKIWSLRYQNGTVTELSDRTTQLAPVQDSTSINFIASFGEDAAGRIYIVDLDGEIFRLQVEKIISGGVGNDSLIGGGSDETLLGKAGNDTLKANNGNDNLQGGEGNDLLLGGGGRDQLKGIGLDYGVGSIDTLTGGPQEDVFWIGDRLQVYYNDGDNTQPGLTDYAVVKGFNVTTDRLQLHGSANRYLLGNSPIPNLRGTALYLDTNRNRSFNPTDELIAIITGTTPINLTANYFSYV